MEIDVAQWVILFLGTATAGWIDAVIGGGGLILIPLLLAVLPSLACGALGTSKLASVTGTGSAAVTLARKVKLDKAEMARFILIALVCSGLGASVASSLDKDVMRPIIIVLMVAVGIFVAFKPDFGSSDAAGIRGGWRTVVVLVLSGIISFYDGIFGPGTGMF